MTAENRGVREGQVAVRVRSDRRDGRLCLWPSPPGRWRQHRAGSAGAGPEWRMASGRAGRSSPGPPSSRWSGASPRLAAARHVGRRVCAQTSASAWVPGDVAFERLGLWPMPQGEGRAAGSPPPSPWGPGREVRPGGHFQIHWDRVAWGLGGRRATCLAGAGREQLCPCPSRGVLPPSRWPVGPAAVPHSWRLCANAFAQEAFVDCSRLKINTFLSH